MVFTIYYVANKRKLICWIRFSQHLSVGWLIPSQYRGQRCSQLYHCENDRNQWEMSKYDTIFIAFRDLLVFGLFESFWPPSPPSRHDNDPSPDPPTLDKGEGKRPPKGGRFRRGSGPPPHHSGWRCLLQRFRLYLHTNRLVYQEEG
jgi:hypothetical protein